MEGFISITSIILFFVSFFLFLDAAASDSDKSGIAALITILLAVGLLGSLIYASTKCEKQPWQREDPYVTHTVMALQDGNEINGKLRGSRYCMSGYINEKFTYVYGYKTVGGGMKIQKAGEDTTTVYFRDDMTPCAKWYRETRKFWFVEEERYTCDIFVPTDSLEASITIDLK